MLCLSRSIFPTQTSSHPWIRLHRLYRFSICICPFHEAFLYNSFLCTRLRWCISTFLVLILRLERILLRKRYFYVYEFPFLADGSRPIILHISLLLGTSKHHTRSLSLISIRLRKLIHCSRSIYLLHVSFRSKTLPCTLHRCFFRSLTSLLRFHRLLRKFTWVKWTTPYHFSCCQQLPLRNRVCRCIWEFWSSSFWLSLWLWSIFGSVDILSSNQRIIVIQELRKDLFDRWWDSSFSTTF